MPRAGRGGGSEPVARPGAVGRDRPRPLAPRLPGVRAGGRSRRARHLHAERLGRGGPLLRPLGLPDRPAAPARARGLRLSALPRPAGAAHRAELRRGAGAGGRRGLPAVRGGRGGPELRVLYHLAFLQDYLPSDINVVFWSLAVEEKFYLLAPFLVRPCLRPERRPSAARHPPGAGARCRRSCGRSPSPGWRRPSATRPSSACCAARSTPASSRCSPASGSARGGASGLACPPGAWRRAIFPAAALGLLAWLASHDLWPRSAASRRWCSRCCNALLCALRHRRRHPAQQARPAPFARAAGRLATLSFALYLVHFPLGPLAAALAAAAAARRPASGRSSSACPSPPPWRCISASSGRSSAWRDRLQAARLPSLP